MLKQNLPPFGGLCFIFGRASSGPDRANQHAMRNWLYDTLNLVICAQEYPPVAEIPHVPRPLVTAEADFFSCAASARHYKHKNGTAHANEAQFDRSPQGCHHRDPALDALLRTCYAILRKGACGRGTALLAAASGDPAADS